MVQQVPALVRPVRLSDSAAIQAELSLPNPRRLLIGSCVAIVLLGLLVIGAIWYAVRSLDEMSLDMETQRAQAAIEAVLAEGALPDAMTAAHLTRAFSLADAHFGGASTREGEISIAVPGSDARLSWTPRRLGQDLFYQLAPVRLLTSALFLTGIAVVLSRLYKLTRELEARRRAAHELASRDALTGLYNRLGFEQQRSVAPASSALLYLDLDGFKQVNDSFGHSAGDDLLRIVAERLARLARPGDVVARIGGDEFAFLRCAPTSRGELAELAADIGVSLSEPVRLGTAQIQIGASIGIAMGSEHAEDRARLVNAADSALYRAKALPGHAFVFADAPPTAAAA
jgi:diguanylate cyclase (GGDEF)-like protein